MFVQLIQGRAKDPAGLKKQFDRWVEELKPGSVGFIGATGGVAEDGTFFEAARFESAEAAKQNSDRPEQGQWWSETEQYVEDVKFTDSTDIEEWPTKGNPDNAGFVQIIQGRTSNRARGKEIDDLMMERMPDLRPDVIGSYTVWEPDDRFTSVIYFTSEAEAREGEKKETPAELADVFDEMGNLMTDVKYIDLKDPWLV